MNVYKEALKRVPDHNATYVYKIGYSFSYKESPGWQQKNCGVITYPCCPFCGTRTGEDNRDFKAGTFCDIACYIANQMFVHKVDYTEEELIEEERLRQLHFQFYL